MKTVRHLLFDAVRQFPALLAAFVLFATAAQAAAGGLGLFGSDFHTPIPNGDTTPQPADGTDFGGTPVGQAVSHPFYLSTPPSPDITLTGTPDRVALSGTGAAAFKVTFLEYTSTLPTNYGSRFVIQFLPATGGTFSATVTIQSDDSANPTYTFAITGTGNAPIVVTTTSDTPAAGQTTLREAITLANSQPGDDTITFDPSVTGTIQLNSALPDLSSNVTITGPGANVLAVRRADAAGRFRIFTIAPSATVDISGLTITNGYAVDGASSFLMGGKGEDGGGILNSGTLHLARVAVSGNQAGNGGAATLPTGQAGGGGAGGGILNGDGATLTLTDSTVSGNRAGQGGDGGTAGGPGGSGGGLLASGTGTVTITHCTFSGNTTGAGGTGLLGKDSAGDGGGIANAGPLTLTSSTLTGNAIGGAGGRGGGLTNQGGNVATVGNTIIAGNVASDPADGPDVRFGFASQGYNLLGQTDGSTGFTVTGDQTGTSAAPLDPRLGPLADNGGPTPTHALLFRSPAIDMGKNLVVDIIEFDVPGFPPSTSTVPSIFDQRGSRRTVDLADALYPNATGGDGTDIGAYEAQVEPPAPEIGANDAVAATRAGTRIYPLANDVLPGSLPLRLVNVSNPAIAIDGRSLVIPAGFTGPFTYTFTDGITAGQARVDVTDGVEATNARSFSGLLLAPDGSIAGAVDATFSATGRTATVRMTAGERVARFVVSFPAGARTGSRFIGFGELTLTRDADGTVSASFASVGDLLTGSLRPRKASASVARYNVALASIDAAIPGGGYLILSTTASSAAVLVGRLPDGRVFASSTSLRDDGTVAFHSIVRRGVNPRELVGGELVFADLLATDLTGELAWAKPIQRPGVPGLHLGGVNTILTANGCQFKGQPLPSGPGILRLSGGNLHLLEETPLMLRAGRPPGPTRSLVSWVADPKLGTFHARVDVLAVLVDGAGVYLPKSGSAWGFFPGTTVGGRIELTPP